MAHWTNASHFWFLAHLGFIQNILVFLIFSSPAPKWTFKILLAVGSAVIGAFLGFPGMRSANMHLDSLYYCRETPVMM